MYNPFKNTYKIIESKNLDCIVGYYIKYGNFFFHKWIGEEGQEFEYFSTAESCGGEFKTLDEVKSAIRQHLEKILDKRLAQTTTKTIARI